MSTDMMYMQKLYYICDVYILCACYIHTWLDLPVDGPEGRKGADGLVPWYRSDHPSLSVDNIHLAPRFKHGEVVLVKRRPELPVKIAGKSGINDVIAYTFFSDW